MDHSKPKGALIALAVVGGCLGFIWWSAERQKTAAALSRKASIEQKIAAYKERQASEQTPEAIEKREHEEQLAALDRAAAEEKEQARQQAAEAGCRDDALCWYKRHNLDADLRCARAVESLAQYEVEWTDSLFGKRKFERVAWADKGAGALILMGSSIKMQNGFGAWRKVSYSCVYSTATSAAVASAQ